MAYRYLDFSAITPEHVAGSWQVARREPSRSQPLAPLTQATGLILASAGEFRTPDTALPGSWVLVHDATLRRPYLHLELRDHTGTLVPTRALITHLAQHFEQPDEWQLSLYLDSGLSLELTRSAPAQ